MKRTILFSICFLLVTVSSLAQDEEEETEKKGFKKENLFTGGSVSLGLGFGSSTNTFSIGASPVFGYSITNWLDAGVVVNYSYTSYKFDDNIIPGGGYKARISNYGAGVFTKLYPFRFLFVQAQAEHNFTRQKFVYSNGNPDDSYNNSANSLLLGAGYAGSRDPFNKTVFFHIAILFDVLNDPYSPYTDNQGRIVPNISAGVQIPLFQGRREESYDRY